MSYLFLDFMREIGIIKEWWIDSNFHFELLENDFNKNKIRSKKKEDSFLLHVREQNVSST
jgi:hypothetical protein